ncbi:MAG TPA: hypothetical protein PLL78_08650 [Fimbriimonadaceae bacterium]|nr:hypothetical protein [Fimbriimonadaceae bacterium]HRJ96745.1 hypothetical protein [Fimbriimonadaceae bacterium]
MPITSVGSWLPTIDEFITHWTAVNAFLNPSELVLLDGYDLATLQLDRASVAGALSDVQGKLNLRTIASGDRDIKRAAIRGRIGQFRAAVQAQLPGSRYLASLPKLPTREAAPGKWRDALDDMLNLWTAVNANNPAVPGFTPPLVLGGPYAVAAFTTEKTAVDAAFTTVATTDQNLQQAREMRDSVFAPVYAKLKEYRLGVIGGLPPGNPLLDSIPRLTPPAGSTPPATNMSAVWNPATEEADMTWEALDLPSLDYWSIRAHPGPKWRNDEAETIGQVFPPGLTFSTDHGLVAPGSSVLLAVFTVTTTGNERRSNVVKVIRP